MRLSPSADTPAPRVSGAGTRLERCETTGPNRRTWVKEQLSDREATHCLKEKLIKIGTKVVSHGRYVTFQMAEVAGSLQMFAEILMLIARLRAPPSPA
jgi:hypothetical protein